MLQRFLMLWLVLSSGVAYFWPTVVPGMFDPFVNSKAILTPLISLVMFSVGSMLKLQEVQEVGRRWPAVVFGTSVQYACMPLLAYLIGHAFGFDKVTLLGVIMVGCVPGAMASNVLTITSRGNVSYSVALTTLATMLSPIAVPVALWLTLDVRGELKGEFSFWGVSQQLLIQVVLPVLAGFGLRRLSGTFERMAERWGSVVANLVILWIIAAVVGLNRPRLASVLGFRDGGLMFSELKLITALLLINVLGYASGYVSGWLAGLKDSMRRALTLEVGMQNCGLGTTLVLQLFPAEEYAAAAIPTAAYTFGCVFTATFLANYWSAKPVADEPPASRDAAYSL
ncbi:MAG: bile acid:sodium symporter family protein [Planctomycetes bacterium]|nr:bile acid:sodium symporter family protein [Planctomycetota bacterium]